MNNTNKTVQRWNGLPQNQGQFRVVAGTTRWGCSREESGIGAMVKLVNFDTCQLRNSLVLS